ncbi:MAG TPA: Wzz/FepE/Etk N-terminal domain-containing protein [Candidatus Aquilonibacter sp.]|nr:Wzz/FepE/Etk N-terminal domain-containing protein [Candidatus Aquilonibacter sp.]
MPIQKILGFALLVAGLALCGAGQWLLLSPPQYQATARITAEPDSIPPMWDGNDPYFIQTEYEIIQSPSILSNVVESLNLNVEWGKKYGDGSPLEIAKAIKLLQGRIKVEPVHNTRLIEISFSSEDPNEAARIANAIAKAYQDYRMELQVQRIRGGIQVLMDYYQKDAQDINANQESLDQLRKQLNVPTPEPDDELLKSNYPAYYQAKQNLQKKIDFHKLLHAEIEQKKIDLAIPKTSDVQIVDAAEPPKFPIGPDRPLGAVLLVIGLFPTVGGFLFLKSSRLSSA